MSRRISFLRPKTKIHIIEIMTKTPERNGKWKVKRMNNDECFVYANCIVLCALNLMIKWMSIGVNNESVNVNGEWRIQHFMLFWGNQIDLSIMIVIFAHIVCLLSSKILWQFLRSSRKLYDFQNKLLFLVTVVYFEFWIIQYICFRLSHYSNKCFGWAWKCILEYSICCDYFNE